MPRKIGLTPSPSHTLAHGVDSPSQPAKQDSEQNQLVGALGSIAATSGVTPGNGTSFVQREIKSGDVKSLANFPEAKDVAASNEKGIAFLENIFISSWTRFVTWCQDAWNSIKLSFSFKRSVEIPPIIKTVPIVKTVIDPIEKMKEFTPQKRAEHMNALLRCFAVDGVYSRPGLLRISPKNEEYTDAINDFSNDNFQLRDDIHPNILSRLLKDFIRSSELLASKQEDLENRFIGLLAEYNKEDKSEFNNGMNQLMNKMDPDKKIIFKQVINLCRKIVVAHAYLNDERMTAEALSVVISPNLIRNISNLGKSKEISSLLQYIIENEEIFPVDSVKSL